jgi:hypothetical protein
MPKVPNLKKVAKMPKVPKMPNLKKVPKMPKVI